MKEKPAVKPINNKDKTIVRVYKNGKWVWISKRKW